MDIAPRGSVCGQSSWVLVMGYKGSSKTGHTATWGPVSWGEGEASSSGELGGVLELSRLGAQAWGLLGKGHKSVAMEEAGGGS